jgi:hypothetical protein
MSAKNELIFNVDHPAKNANFVFAGKQVDGSGAVSVPASTTVRFSDTVSTWPGSITIPDSGVLIMEPQTLSIQGEVVESQDIFFVSMRDMTSRWPRALKTIQDWESGSLTSDLAEVDIKNWFYGDDAEELLEDFQVFGSTIQMTGPSLAVLLPYQGNPGSL